MCFLHYREPHIWAWCGIWPRCRHVLTSSTIFTAVARVIKGQSLTVKQFQKLLGLMAAASLQRPCSGGTRPRGFPRGKGFSHVAMPMCLRHVKGTLVHVSGPSAGSSLLSRNANDTGWSAVMSGWSGRHLMWHINCPEMLAVFRALKHFLPDPCVGAHWQHSGGLLHQPPGRSAFAPPLQAGTPDPCVGPRETPLAESSVHPGASQCGSRQPGEAGAKPRRMDTPSRLGGSDLESVWQSSGGTVCD